MKTIRMIWVGKTRERSLREETERYLGLIAPWLTVNVVEIRPERGSAGREIAMQKEGGRILRATTRFILLDAGGRTMTTRAFANYLDGTIQSGPVDWVIGGAFGVSPEVRARARERLSLSPMTFTHEMTRIVLLEQVYRALTIIHGKKYHY